MEMFNGREVIRIIPKGVGIPQMCTYCVCTGKDSANRSICLAPEDIVCWEEIASGDCVNDCYFVYK